MPKYNDIFFIIIIRFIKMCVCGGYYIDLRLRLNDRKWRPHTIRNGIPYNFPQKRQKRKLFVSVPLMHFPYTPHTHTHTSIHIHTYGKYSASKYLKFYFNMSCAKGISMAGTKIDVSKNRHYQLVFL